MFFGYWLLAAGNQHSANSRIQQKAGLSALGNAFGKGTLPECQPRCAKLPWLNAEC